ncbi:hypothetical protein BJ980_000317 [Nocardioides daedukensis]|uniref:DUF998 domain-containing protein n=1 Tax=Nocardioides daedukensis TaxID=634462 RepID=A0A7Y9RY26_9ACTN|nr:DUF998 domain-containing protein [Nocardioides daedukensis]NYG57394.1 hypothetical protein [Nocardioides daedukensis]
MRHERTVRLLAASTLAAVVAFLVLDVIASAVAADGYSMKRDYVSSLAADGSSVAALGSLCLAAFALAHLLAGILMLAAWRTKIAGAFLVLAGVLFGLVVLFRADCHHGEAGCGTGQRSGLISLEAGMHGVVAGTLAAVMFFTMLVAVVSAFFERGPDRVAGFLALPFFWASFTGIGMMNKSEAIGAWERLWLGASVGWLVVLAMAALLAQRRRRRPAPR